jgi:ATP-dependent DNA helicase Q1
VTDSRLLQYFATTATLPGSAFDPNSLDEPTPCNHCDNCLRSKDTVENLDVTLEAWKIVSLATAIAAVKDGKTRYTFTQLADIVRGVKTDGIVLVDGNDAGGYVGMDKKLRLNLETTCGGPAFLTKDVSGAAFLESGTISYERYLSSANRVACHATLSGGLS